MMTVLRAISYSRKAIKRIALVLTNSETKISLINLFFLLNKQIYPFEILIIFDDMSKTRQ